MDEKQLAELFPESYDVKENQEFIHVIVDVEKI